MERVFWRENDRTLWQSLLYYKRLRNASPVERENYEFDAPEPKGISLFFLSHPEINASEIGLRLGISKKGVDGLWGIQDCNILYSLVLYVKK